MGPFPPSETTFSQCITQCSPAQAVGRTLGLGEKERPAPQHSHLVHMPHSEIPTSNEPATARSQSQPSSCIGCWAQSPTPAVLLSLAVTVPDNPFQGPHHPQAHPSLGNPGAHPLSLSCYREPRFRGIPRGHEVFGNPSHQVTPPCSLEPPSKNSWLPSGHEAPRFSYLSSNLAPCPKRGAEAPKTSIWRWRGVLTSTLPPKLKPPFPAHQPQPPCPGNQATCVQRQSWERGSRRLKINFAEERE